MPKMNDSTKSKLRSKSKRKPLRDVSNAGTALNSATVYKKTSKENVGEAGDDLLDCLLLVHSDLSSIIRQVDQLVVQALQLTNKKKREEIKHFTDVLSEMQTSLKPWVPRLQKALSSQSIGPNNKSGQPVERALDCVTIENNCAVTESPELTKWESLVSPSPLVSWRAECNTEGGRQLFLLTPLPQTKSFSLKCQPSSIPAFEKNASDETTLLMSTTHSARNLGEGVATKPTSNNVLDTEVTKTVGHLEIEWASPEKPSRMKGSMFTMTPCLKMSPPKSCILLEPVSEFSKKKIHEVHKCTPFPTGAKNFGGSLDSDASSSPSPDDVTIKYPELLGIRINNLEDRMKVADNSPTLVFSPPKTCSIMEPDENLLANLPGNCLLPRAPIIFNKRENLYSTGGSDIPAVIHNKQENLSTGESDIPGDTDSAVKTHHQQVDLEESTPMIKDFTMAIGFRKGKNPGENTLKKELWTKFEAASTYGVRLTGKNVFQDTTYKGFLERLEGADDS